MPVVLDAAGKLLALLFLVIFLRRHQYRTFPYFAGYFIFVFVRLISITAIYHRLTEPFYNHLYWATANMATAFRFLVIWEVVRQLTPKGHRLRPLLGRASAVFLTGAAIAFYIMGPEGNVFSDLERKLGLAGAAWLALVFVLALVCGLPLTRPVWGMMTGVGLIASISLTNFSALGIFTGFQTSWALIRQSSFSLMMLCYLWGFWKQEEPAPNTPAPLVSQLAAVEEHWQRAEARVRSLANPDQK